MGACLCGNGHSQNLQLLLLGCQRMARCGGNVITWTNSRLILVISK
jgi:hypothetical protein